MSASTNDVIYPCPFSKAYGIPSKQAWRLLEVFAGYRLLVAILFIFLFYHHINSPLVVQYDAVLFQFCSAGYLLTCLLSLPLIFWRLAKYAPLAELSVFTDIVFITLIMHASGGVASGMGILLAVSIAAGGLLIGGRCALLFAALATLAVLSEQVYVIQIEAFKSQTLIHSAMLGVSFFTVVLLSFVLTQRYEQSSLLVRQQTRTIAQLEELNRYIIQHLQSGLMLVDGLRRVQLCNQSTLRLLGLDDMPDYLPEVSVALPMAFGAWLDNPELDFAVVPWPERGDLQVRFSKIDIGEEPLYLLIIEDIVLYNQRLQQSKLASLGRLTASIAHEIRNPLSAIRHAGQLLSENSDLQAQDRRLTQIIETHSQRINRIIDNVLLLSRRHGSQRQKILLDSWLKDYLEESRNCQDFGESCFRLSIKTAGQSVFVDADHLKQILDNLCSNAIRYGRPELGPINIELDRAGEAVCIRVVDNGLGVSAKNIQHLYEPFFTTSHQGTGLGLYICQELAQLNQAELKYALHDGKSCFTLLLANAEHTFIEL